MKEVRATNRTNSCRYVFLCSLRSSYFICFSNRRERFKLYFWLESSLSCQNVGFSSLICYFAMSAIISRVLQMPSRLSYLKKGPGFCPFCSAMTRLNRVGQGCGAHVANHRLHNIRRPRLTLASTVIAED